MNHADQPENTPTYSLEEPTRAEVLPEVEEFRGRPGGLTAVSIIALVLGTLGLFAALFKGTNLIAGEQIQEFQMGFSQAGASPAMREAQQQMNREVAAVAERYQLVNALMCVAQMLLSAALVYGGIASLKLNAAGRKVLLLACLAAIVYELLQAIPYVMTQLEMLPIMDRYIDRLLESSEGTGPNDQAAQFGGAIARVSVIFGIVVALVWTLAKIIFYGVASWYLRRERTLRLFAAPR